MASLQRPKPNPLLTITTGVVTTLAATFGAQPTQALDAYFEVGTAIERYSNALRTSDDEQSDTLNSLLARASASHSGPELEANLNYSIEKQRYQDDSYDDENVTGGGANIDWRILDDRISLLVDHNTSDTVINSNEPSTPDNRTRRSVLSAGPRFTLHPSQVDNIELTTRRIDVNVDDIAESDSERDEASLRWNRRLPQLRNFHIATSYADVMFDEQPDQDYKFTTAAVGFSSASAIGTFAAEVGINRADRDILDDVDGESLNISWNSREDRSPVRWSISYVSAITDSSLGFGGESSTPSGGGSSSGSGGSGSGSGSGGASSDLTVIDIVKRDELGFSAATLIGAINTELTLTGSSQKQDYEEALNDDRIDSAGLTLSHQISPRAGVYTYADKIRQDFLDTNEELEDLQFGVGGNYTIVRSLNLSWSVYRLKRDHSVEALSFTDNVYRLELTYGFGFGANAENRTPTATSPTARPTSR